MSLGVFENKNMTAYITGGNFASTETGNQSTWINPQDVPVQGEVIWVDKFNLIQTRWVSSGSIAGYLRMDPNLIDNTSGSIIRVNTQSSLVNRSFAVSAYIPSTGEQRMFARKGSGADWTECDIVNPAVDIDPAPFPFVRSTTPDPTSGVTNVTDGYYNNSSSRSDMLFFMGWDRLGNGNPIGTALMFAPDSLRWGGVSVSAPTTYIDMSTALGEPVEEMPSLHSTSPANIYQGGPFLGSTSIVAFKWAQFIPDFDSIPTAPKGRIVLADTLNSGDIRTLFVKVFDFNPEGVTTFPERIHWRVTLESQIILERTTDYATYPGADSNLIPTNTVPSCFIRFNPVTGRFFIIDSRQNGSVSDFNTGVYHTVMLETTAAAVVDAITPPVPNVAIETNRTVVMRQTVVGDLGELIPGETVTWDLERITTRNEQLVIAEPRSPGDSADAVENIPISDSPTYPFEVRKDDVALVETTNYTVNRTTGVVTFIAPEPVDGSVYNIDYGHPTNPATPAIGTLLSPSGRTNEDGEVTTRISYADEPLNEGFVDRLTGTTAT
ncbi:MAG: hypothetical protein WBG86_06290 [Polyangiales bacterium]